MNTPNYSVQPYKGKYYLLKADTSEAVGFLTAQSAVDACQWCNAQTPVIAAAWFSGLAMVQSFVIAGNN